MHGQEIEQNYQFRARMLEVHKPGRRMPFAACGEGQIEITDAWTVWIPQGADRVLYHAARDLEDYFAVSMGVFLRVQIGGAPPSPAILYEIDPALTGNRYRLTVREGQVLLCGGNSRTAAQAGYFAEDLMNFAEGPYLSLQSTCHAPLYETRMVHSGYGLDLYPDRYMQALAHAGFTALLLFVCGINQTARGYQDFNELIDRAAGYGLDVYVYSYLKNEVYPEGPEAEAFYDRLYGDLFRACPGFKGVILVGESCEFRSRDPRTSGKMRLDAPRKPGDKPLPGWYPCSDYPLLLNQIGGAVHRVKPEAEIVLWSYNWGKQPEEPRLELLRSLPEGITLEATFEMFEYIEREGVQDRIADYALYFEGPGKYFASEAEEAARLGIRLYSMTNTAGATWDIGVVPYLPAPGQWMRRIRAMRRYHDQCGLCGLMESHHFGVYPSFITDLAKWMFHSPDTPEQEILRRLAVRDFSESAADRVLEAWEWFSRGVRRIATNSVDQYGPYRIGPGYPLLMEREYELPSVPWAHFGGNQICNPAYPYRLDSEEQYRRIEHEMRYAAEARDCCDRGAALIEATLPLIDPSKRQAAARMAALGRFMARAAQTTLHTKQWRLAKERRDWAAMLAIGEEEIKNAQAALPLAAFDSRLGWEPSMEYMSDPAHIRWKIETIRRVLNEEIRPRMK